MRARIPSRLLLWQTLKQVASLVDVAQDLLIGLSNGRARLSSSRGRSGLGVDGHALLALVSLVGASKGLCQHEVTVSADCVGLTNGIVLVVGSATHSFLGSDDIVGVGNPSVVSFPQVIRTPSGAGEEVFHVVNGVIPEPSRTRGTHNHVVAHHLGHEVVGTNTEALVSVTSGRPSSSVHRAVDTIQWNQCFHTVAHQSGTTH